MVAQKLLSGVKIYVKVPATAVLIESGAHLPVTPLLETVGKVGAAEFWQTELIKSKAVTVFGLMVTLIESMFAHCPASGVNL